MVVCDPRTDLFNPNVVRASIGTLFTVPTLTFSTATAHGWLATTALQVVAAIPDAPLLYSDADLRGPLALVVGTEQWGLSEVWRERADLLVSIPMRGRADSLNVATAATLLLYEVVRQRSLP